MSLKEIGCISMRRPDGGRSQITVTRHDDTGRVDLHFTRAEEGEVLVVLPPSAAQKLAELMAEATHERTT